MIRHGALLLVLAALPASAQDLQEKGAAARAAVWDGLATPEGPSRRQVDTEAFVLLRLPPGAPAITAALRTAAPGPTDAAGAATVRRFRLAGRWGWEFGRAGHLTWLLPHRGRTLSLSAAYRSPTEQAALKRVITGLVPLDPVLWDPAFEAWRDGLGAAAAGVDDLVHWDPERRRRAFARLGADARLLRRALRDPDLPVRFEAARRAGPTRPALAVEALGSGDLRAARQLLLATPPARRYALQLRLAETAVPARSLVALTRWIGTLRGPAAAAHLRARWGAGVADARVALEALLRWGDPAALAHARRRLGAPTTPDPLLSMVDAARWVAVWAPRSERRTLDRQLRRLERHARREAFEPAVGVLVGLDAHLRWLASDASPAAERGRLARLLATGTAPSWVHHRHARLLDPENPAAGGAQLACLRLPRGALPLTRAWRQLAALPGKDAAATARWEAQSHRALAQLLAWGPQDLRGVGAFTQGTGIALDAPAVAWAWRPAPGRPFAPVGPATTAFPFALALGVGDGPALVRRLARGAPGLPSPTHMTHTNPGRVVFHGPAGPLLAVRVQGTRAVLGPSQRVLDDALAAVPDTAAAGGADAALDLPLHTWIAQADVPSLLGATAAMFVDEQVRLELTLRVASDRVATEVRVTGVPERFRGLLENQPVRRFAAPRDLLPADTRGVLIAGIAPGAVLDLFRNWPLKMWQKPVGWLVGSQRAQVEQGLLALRSEAGLAWVPAAGKLHLVGFVNVDPRRARPEFERLFPRALTQGGVALRGRGTTRARLVGRFCCVAGAAGPLLRLGTGPKLGTTPRWREVTRARKLDAVIAWLDLASLADGGRIPGPLGRLGAALGWLRCLERGDLEGRASTVNAWEKRPVRDR